MRAKRVGFGNDRSQTERARVESKGVRSCKWERSFPKRRRAAKNNFFHTPTSGIIIVPAIREASVPRRRTAVKTLILELVNKCSDVRDSPTAPLRFRHNEG